MPRKHTNMVILAGPLSNYKIYNADAYGNTKVGFRVSLGPDEQGNPRIPILVSSKLKFDWMIEQGQKAKSVMINKGFMNGWVKDDGELGTNVGVSGSGLYFLNDQIDTHSAAVVEGVITNVSGEWVTIKSSYVVPNAKDKNKDYHRIVVARFQQPQDPGAVGALAYVIGRPNPKYNDQWYLHMEVVKGWIMKGKK